jgi:hypothetical protein
MEEIERIACKKVALFATGLPGRGKSYFTAKIGRFFSWLGFNAHVISTGA